MKYEGQRPSGQDKQVPVYLFAMNKDEVELLLGTVKKVKDVFPKTPETEGTHQRLRMIYFCLRRFVVEELKKKNGWF